VIEAIDVDQRIKASSWVKTQDILGQSSLHFKELVLKRACEF
jgi:hypothetical protein